MQKIEKKLARYFTRNIEGRAPLNIFLQTISLELGDSSIFGGMIRDFGLGYARSFKSDIDIVTTSPEQDIYKVIKQFNPTRNKFGGFRFYAAGNLFDIWSLGDTWAIKEGFVCGDTIGDLCKTTFFSLDAAIFLLKSNSLIANQDYERNISNRILDVNLVKHPSPEKMAIRAIHMAIYKNLEISPRLGEFIARTLYKKKTHALSEAFVTQLSRHLVSSNSSGFKFSPQISFLSDTNHHNNL